MKTLDKPRGRFRRRENDGHLGDAVEVGRQDEAFRGPGRSHRPYDRDRNRPETLSSLYVRYLGNYLPRYTRGY